MVLKVEGGVLPGFGVQGEKTDFRESWRRLLPNKNYGTGAQHNRGPLNLRGPLYLIYLYKSTKGPFPGKKNVVYTTQKASQARKRRSGPAHNSKDGVDVLVLQAQPSSNKPSRGLSREGEEKAASGAGNALAVTSFTRQGAESGL